MKSKIAVCKEFKKTANVNYHDADISLVKNEIQIRYEKNNVICLSKKDLESILGNNQN